MKERYTGENSSETAGLPEKEQIASGYILWLAGLLEAGGSIGFGRGRDRGGKVYVKPVITYNDDSEERIGRIQEIFGGSVHKKVGENTFEWRLKTSAEVVQLARELGLFAPSRGGVITAICVWGDTQGREERVGLAERVKGKSRIDVQAGIYEEILCPEFIAGVFDARGGIFYNTYKGERISPRIVIASVNGGLLRALKNRFGGKVRKVNHAKGFISKKDSFVWWLGRTNRVNNFIDFIYPYLVIKRGEV